MVWPTCPHKGNHIVQKAYAALANTLAAGNINGSTSAEKKKSICDSSN